MKKILHTFIIGLFLINSLAPAIAQAAEFEATTTLQENLDNVVYIACGFWITDDYYEYWASGSGVVLGENVILTNAHVGLYIDEYNDVYAYDFCLGGIAPNAYTPPDFQFYLEPVLYQYDSYFDYAFMEAYDIVEGEYVDYEFDSAVTYGNSDSLIIGDSLDLVGYPGVAGETITATSGQVSGFNGHNWIKSDATADFGNSGGGAFDSLGNLVGMPSAVVIGEANSYTYIQNLNAIIEDALGYEVIQRDYDTLYTEDNIVCLTDVGCFNLGEGEEAELEVTEDEEVEVPDAEDPVENENVTSAQILEGQYDPTQYDAALVERMLGYILLQVDQHGEAYYINPADKLRYYMKDGLTAYTMMRNFGLGITDVNLDQIEIVEDANEMLTTNSVCSTNALANSIKGKILLQVEQHGEAYYIHPDTCKGIYMKDGNAAYDIMRFLSKGILSEDLAKMPSGEI